MITLDIARKAEELRQKADDAWHNIVYYDNLGDYDTAESYGEEYRGLLEEIAELTK